MSRDAWKLHPDQLAGKPFAEYMLWDFTALALVEQEELKT